ncbi:hypothetical protein F4X90_20710, partial [Candidatus Poribacteria bacterium]|nr:hypothetical protein [Candidatus Poribacteria bacterium]
MKTHIFRKVLWFCLLWVSVVGYAQEATETWMPDAALRAVVQEALELPANVPLTKKEMQELAFLDANHRGIVDITGLEFATNLRKLY